MSLLLTVVLVLSSALTVQAQQASAPVDPTTLGPQAGQAVPDFEAPDQHGTARRLSSLLGPKGTMLVFSRSVDW